MAVGAGDLQLGLLAHNHNNQNKTNTTTNNKKKTKNTEKQTNTAKAALDIFMPSIPPNLA